MPSLPTVFKIVFSRHFSTWTKKRGHEVSLVSNFLVAVDADMGIVVALLVSGTVRPKC